MSHQTSSPRHPLMRPPDRHFLTEDRVLPVANPFGPNPPSSPDRPRTEFPRPRWSPRGGRPALTHTRHPTYKLAVCAHCDVAYAPHLRGDIISFTVTGPLFAQTGKTKV